MEKLKCVLVLLALCGAGPAEAQEDQWHLLVEPQFMRYDAAWPVPGSDRTVLVPARFINGEVLPLRRDEILKLGVNRNKILASAPKAAEEVLATLTPRYVRDGNQVIQFAVLESDSPLTASAVLAPSFGRQFAETLGPDVLVSIPNRHRIFVFSRLSPAYRRMADLVVSEYQSAANPVSREVFEAGRGKLAAIGRYQ